MSPVNDAPIRSALYQNQVEITRLSDLIEQLESRLIPVLNPVDDGTKVGGNTVAPLPPSSEYEAILRDQGVQMERLGYRLQQLLNNLAV